MAMSISIITVLVLLNTGVSLPASKTGDEILGIWVTEDNSAWLEFSRSGKTFQARLIWLAEPNRPDGHPKTDRNNPDARLQNRTLLGIPVIWNLLFQDDKWVNGAIYSIKRGTIADCTVEMPDTQSLRIKVYKGILSGTQTWKRKK
jgi:uncharacterized protein (DUF2147 family)